MTPTAFRSILAASVVTGLFAAAFDLVFPSAIPEILSDAFDLHHQETLNPSNLGMVVATLVFCIVILIVGIAATVGLFQFRSWAPRLALIASFLGSISTVMIGPTLMSGWATAFFVISTLLWGGALALAYFSPLKERFVRVPR